MTDREEENYYSFVSNKGMIVDGKLLHYFSSSIQALFTLHSEYKWLTT